MNANIAIARHPYITKWIQLFISLQF